LSNHEIEPEHEDAVIKFLCSESGSHDYTMHRKEAKELGLNIEKPDMDLYNCIKAIYDDIEKELELRTPFEPNVILGNQNQVTYQLRRALIESVEYGCDVFVSEGTLNKQIIQQQNQQQQTMIHDNRTFEGWRQE